MSKIWQFAKAGKYTVTLTVTDNDGATKSISQDISVKEEEKKGIPAFDLLSCILIIIIIVGYRMVGKNNNH